MIDKKEQDAIKNNIQTLFENVKNAAERSGRKKEDITVLLATKTQSAEKINYAGNCGIKYIGENRVQELLEKYDELDRDKFHIHFIGTLQKNKVKYIIDKVELIHSVNSLSLAKEIDKQASKAGKIMDVLLEVNAACEETKTGMTQSELYEILPEIAKLQNIRVLGLMAIPPKMEIKGKYGNECENIDENMKKMQNNFDTCIYFKKIKQIFLDISQKKLDNSSVYSNMQNISMQILSLGMSGDYIEAIEQGSTLIRPGRAVFGERQK